MAAAASDHSITINDCSIHYRKWDKDFDLNKPTFLFVHGNGANLHWWDFIAPAFLGKYNVVAIDLSGSGDSEHRSEYSLEVFSREIIGVCEDANLKNITVIGHSFGGSVARSCAFLNPGFFSRLILVDSSFEARKSYPAMSRKKKCLEKILRHSRGSKKTLQVTPPPTVLKPVYP